MSGARVITNLDRIQPWQSGAKLRVYGFDGFPALSSTPDVWLIRNHNQNKAGFLKSAASIRRVGINFELLCVRGRVRAPVADHRPIEDTVAI